jgi:CheY-like chemotaxis protein
MYPPSFGPQILTISEKSILKTAIVDDEADLGELYSKAFQRFGYSTPLVFRDGNSLVDSVVRDGATFDIVLIDFQMPGMNGIEASKIVLQHRPQTKIVLVTANDSVQEDALSLGIVFPSKTLFAKHTGESLEAGGDIR